MSQTMSLLSPILRQFAQEDALLVCIDLEVHCWKHNYIKYQGMELRQRRVSEIGVTIVDSRKIIEVANSDVGVGDRGCNIFEHMQGYEFAIKGAEHDPNIGKHRTWCRGGTPQNFLFGKVSTISKNSISKELTKVIDKAAYIQRSKGQIQKQAKKHRKIVFLFFAKGNDLLWLAENNVRLQELYPNSEVVDMQVGDVCRIITGHYANKSQCAAADIFMHLGVATAATHNGGNDAMFELQAYIAGLCLTPQQYQELVDGRELQPQLPKTWLDPQSTTYGSALESSTTDTVAEGTKPSHMISAGLFANIDHAFPTIDSTKSQSSIKVTRKRKDEMTLPNTKEESTITISEVASVQTSAQIWANFRK